MFVGTSYHSHLFRLVALAPHATPMSNLPYPNLTCVFFASSWPLQANPLPDAGVFNVLPFATVLSPLLRPLVAHISFRGHSGFSLWCVHWHSLRVFSIGYYLFTLRLHKRVRSLSCPHRSYIESAYLPRTYPHCPR